MTITVRFRIKGRGSMKTRSSWSEIRLLGEYFSEQVFETSSQVGTGAFYWHAKMNRR